MRSDLFLTCFVACLFAFITFGLIAWQVSRYLARRAISKHLPDILRQTIHSGTGVPHGESAKAQAAFAELLRNAASAPPGGMAHLATVVCGCGCGREQEVPLELPLQPYLETLGWDFQDRYNGWACPVCVKADRSPGST